MAGSSIRKSTNFFTTKPQIGRKTQLRLNNLDLSFLRALNFIFLADEDQTNCGGDDDDQSAS
jgi:hypothetical protein